jgi:hypothetical protein
MPSAIRNGEQGWLGDILGGKRWLQSSTLEGALPSLRFADTTLIELELIL